MSSQQKVAHNFAFLSAAEVVTRLLGTVLSIMVARTLGVGAFGQLGFAASFVGIINVFADLGLTQLAIRELATGKSNAKAMISHVLILQSALAALLAVGTALIVYFLPIGATVKLVTIITSATLIPAALNMAYVFQATQQMQYVALSRAVGQLVYFVVGVAGLLVAKTILIVPAAQVIGLSIGSLMVAIWLWRENIVALARPRKAQLVSLLVSAMPFLVTGLMVQVFYNTDSIFLQFMKGEYWVGLYQSGYKIVIIVATFTGFVSSALYPQLAHLAGRDDMEAAYLALGNTLRLLGLFILPVAVGGMIAAPRILEELYGGDFVSGTGAFVILLGLLLPLVYNQQLGNLLLATGRQRIAMEAVTLAAVVNFLCNIILIPRFGIEGAAWATIIAEMINLAYMSWRLKWRHSLVLAGKYVTGAFWPTVVMGLALIIWPVARLWTVILIGVLIYAVACWLTGAVSWSELKVLMAKTGTEAT